MSTELSEDLKLSLSKLCKELQFVLNKTEQNLIASQHRFKQVEYILKPWKIINKLEPEECICNTLTNVQISQNDEELSLLNSISKTLTNAQLVKKKSNIKVNSLRRSSETAINTKFKISQNDLKKTVSVQTTSKNNDIIHNPCCPLFKTSIELHTQRFSLNFPEAIPLQKLSPIFIRTIKQSNKLICNVEDKKCTSKDIFLTALEAQNEECYSKFEMVDPSVSTFKQYLSVLNSFETKRKNFNKCDPWIFYNNEKELQIYQDSRFSAIKKGYWNHILKCIISDIIPVLHSLELEQKQKLHLFKILKTIYNFVHSTTPSVPIFRIQTKCIEDI